MYTVYQSNEFIILIKKNDIHYTHVVVTLLIKQHMPQVSYSAYFLGISPTPIMLLILHNNKVSNDAFLLIFAASIEAD